METVLCTAIQGRSLSAGEAGTLSVLFDVGGVFGGIAAGFLSDFLGASATVASGFVYCTIPVLYMYRTYGTKQGSCVAREALILNIAFPIGHLSMALNIALMMMSGFFVNGPYALITTAVSADLGTHESLAGLYSCCMSTFVSEHCMTDSFHQGAKKPWQLSLQSSMGWGHLALL